MINNFSYKVYDISIGNIPGQIKRFMPIGVAQRPLELLGTKLLSKISIIKCSIHRFLTTFDSLIFNN
jgi:hypothetical protein